MIVDTNHDALSVLSCSFCGKSAKEAHLVIGPCVTICEDCIDMAAEIVGNLSGRPIETVAEATWRTLLERDIADAERYILDCQSFFTPTWQGSWERVHIRDCEAWLTRARAALS